MLYLYTLSLSDYAFTESVTAADAIATSDWQIVSPHRLSDGEIEDYANSHWGLPVDEYGYEMLTDFNDLAIIRAAE